MGRQGGLAAAAGARRQFGATLLASSSALAILAAAPVARAQTITVPPNAQTIVIAPGSTKTSISIANNGTVGTPATKTAILLQGGATLPGGITNGGLITATAFSGAAAISAQGTLAGGLTNIGTIAATSAFHVKGVLIGGTLSGGFMNQGLITATGIPGVTAAAIYASTGSALLGGITNAGTIIAPAGPGIAALGTVTNGITNTGVITATGGIATTGTVTNGITNIGTINASGFSGIAVLSGSVAQGITNIGLITASGGTGIDAVGSTITGGITNLGTINTPGGSRQGITVNQATVTGGITNLGLITTGNNTPGINLTNAVVDIVSNAGTIANLGSLGGTGIVIALAVSGAVGSVTNSGAIMGGVRGIALADGTVTGSIVNTGTISVAQFGTGIQIVGGGVGNVVNGGVISVAQFGAGIAVAGSVGGGITNSGTINAPAGILASVSVAHGITNTGVINAADSGIRVGIGTVTGGITNAGTVIVDGFGIIVGGEERIVGGVVSGATVLGGITNSGLLQVTNAFGGTALVVGSGGTVLGAVANTGTISAQRTAISLVQEAGPTTILQSAGAIIGSIIGNGTNAGDVLQVTGGTLALSSGQSVSGIRTYVQSGGTLVVSVDANTSTSGALSAGSVTLGGAFVADPSGSIGALLQGSGTQDTIISGTPIVGQFASVTTTTPLFNAAFAPDATTANALDLVLTPNPAGIAALGGLAATGGTGLTHTGTIRQSAPTVVGILGAGTFTAGILNSGLIDLTGTGARFSVTGIFAGGSFGGRVVNSGTVNVSGTSDPVGILVAGTVAQGLTNTGLVSATGPSSHGISITGVLGGSLVNSGTVAVSGSNTVNNNLGGVATGVLAATVGGGLTNTGLIQVTGLVPQGILGLSGLGGSTASIGGAVVNGSGGIIAVTSTGNGTAAGVQVFLPGGGFTNAGVITVSGIFDQGAVIFARGSFGAAIVNAGTVALAASPIAASPSLNATGLNVQVLDAVQAQGINVPAGTLTGAISNTGLVQIAAAGSISSTFADSSGTGLQIQLFGSGAQGQGVSVLGAVLTGPIVNSGTISTADSTVLTVNGGSSPGSASASAVGIAASATGGGAASGARAAGATLSGGLVNSGLISLVMTGSESAAGTPIPPVIPTANVTGVGIRIDASGGFINNGGQSAGGGVFSGTVLNSGTIAVAVTPSSLTVSAGGQSQVLGVGIDASAVAASSNAGAAPGTVAGSISNTGRILVTVVSASANTVRAAGIEGVAQNGSATMSGVPQNGQFRASVVNAGLISVSASGMTPVADGILLATTNRTADNAGRAASLTGNVMNSGTVLAVATGSAGGRASGIRIGSTAAGTVTPGTMLGGVTNTGVIVASGSGAAQGVGIEVLLPVVGGITNTGTISGNTAAIDLTQEVGGASAITLAGGLIDGAIVGNAANGDTIAVPAGTTAALSPRTAVSGVGSFTVASGGTLALQLTSNTAPGGFPTVSATAVTLNGAVEASLGGNLAGFVPGPTAFRDVFQSGTPIGGSPSVKASNLLFTASLVPDAGTANADDLTVTFAPQNQSLTAQVLAQSLRFGLEGQQVVVDTIENRIQVGRAEQGPGLQFASARGDRLAVSDADQQAQVPAGGSGEGFAMWGRAYGTAGGAPATGTLPGFGEGRIGGIVGADWRFDQFVVGGGFHYAHTEAPFDDGSKTRLEDYQGIVYGGWREGPAYVTALASGGANDYSISRNLTPFGLTVFATSAPTGSLVSAFGEAGYGFDWSGTTLTPYVNLDYIHQHVDGFSEAGAFGAFAVAPANGSSLTTTLGLRASTRIDLGSHGTLVPEMRAGWQHEFLDASQTLTAQLVGTAASPFTVVGTSFGRDSAVVGLGVSHEFAPGASFFVDYDGQFTGGFNQNSGSVGVKVRF